MSEEEALKRIESARNNQTPNLNLAGLGLTKLPETIGQLTQLTTLYLHNNLLSSLPESIDKLSQLTTLHLAHNQFGSLPESITRLSKLWQLHIEHNQLDTLPESIGQLTQLTRLVVGYNKFSVFPDSLCQLPKLTNLYLYGNQLNTLPESFSHLTQLKELHLSQNQFSSLPDPITRLTQLTTLGLFNNQLSTLPKTITRLTKLTSLLLNGNQFTELPEPITQLTNLLELGLGGNELNTLPNAITNLTQLTGLYLQGNKFTTFPQSITRLTNLRHLTFSENQINSLPESITQLTNLTQLILDETLMTTFPESVTQLADLTYLGFSGNRVKILPNSLGQLTKLEKLILSRNLLNTLPETISQLTQLTWLMVNSNQLKSLPDDIGKLTQLTEIHCGGNEIRTLPESIGELTQLRRLLAAQNLLEALPDSISKLTELTELGLSQNQINLLPASITLLPQLTMLNLDDNSIGDAGALTLTGLTNVTLLSLRNCYIGVEGARALLDKWATSDTTCLLKTLDLQGNPNISSVLPNEVLATKDAPSILAAYRRYKCAAEQGTLEPLNEAKLLIVGNEAVGKTSLVRYLIYNKPRNPIEPRTPGAAIHEQIETLSWVTSGSGIKLNVWDFGGQEIMRGTHKYFLTERSLYLLVLEDRREDDQSIYDWLKAVRNRGGASPIIVVINKSDGGKRDLQLEEEELRQENPNIVDFVRTSCENSKWADKSIESLRHKILEILAEHKQLKHVQDPIPTSWLRVKKAIATMARAERVLSFADFQRRCLENDHNTSDNVISDPDEQRSLLRLLHELGVVVAHGISRDAPAVKREITLLDPNWLTGAIYQILNQPEVRDNGGEFTRTQLSNWLDASIYPSERHEFIISMMQDPDVGLCFQLPSKETDCYLIPEALPRNMPYYENWPSDSLRFRYRYDYLPRSLIPRFIVESHNNLTDPPTRWRTGVVLKAANCPILVRGNPAKRQIDIEVDGPQMLRRSALNIVLNHLEKVHARNPEIHPEPYVPLPEEPSIGESYDHLLLLEQRYGSAYKYHPRGADRLYKVSELLEGVRRDQSQIEDDIDLLSSQRIQAGDQSNITIVTGDIFSASSTTQIGNQSHGTLKDHPISSGITSWQYFSIACGFVAVLFAILILALPSNQLRVVVSGILGLGLLVTVFVLGMNPARFYRRVLGYVIPAGLILNTVGGTIDIFATAEPGAGWFYWNRTVSSWFLLAWVIVIGLLIWADLKQNQKS